MADCLRGAEFLQSLPSVDASRVAINGDDLALITAARRPGFAAVQAAGLLFYRLMEARERSNDYPVEEINDYLRTYPETSRDFTHCVPAAQGKRMAAEPRKAVENPLVLRFRSSYHIAAHSFTNFGIKGALASL